MQAKQDALPGLALAFGIGSLVFMMFGGTIFFGSLAIIFALLSRRATTDRRAVIGLVFAIVAMAIYLLIVAAAIYLLIATGTMAQILQDLESVDMSSVNAASDILTIIQKHLAGMYQSLLTQVGGGVL